MENRPYQGIGLVVVIVLSHNHRLFIRGVAGSLVLGAPAKVVRKLSKAERDSLKWWAQKYVDNSAYCLKHKINVQNGGGGGN